MNVSPLLKQIPFIFGAALVATAVHASELKQVLSLEEPAAQGSADSLVWTGVAQLAWDELTKALGEDELRIPNADGTPNALAAWMNAYDLAPLATLPASTKSWAGLDTPAFLERSRKELRALFPDSPQVLDLVPKEGTGEKTLALAALNHQIHFPQKFYPGVLEGMPFTSSDGKKHTVQFFGTRHDWNHEFGDTVSILSYEDRDHFAVELSSKSKEDTVCILLWPELATLDAGIKKWQELKQSKEPQTAVKLSDLDILKIPFVNFESTADFQPRFPENFPTKQGTPHRIDPFKQWINFQMNHTGAKIEVAAIAGGEPFSGMPEKKKIVPRHFVCDQPFFTFLWKAKADKPYAALKLDGDGWRVPWGSPAAAVTAEPAVVEPNVYITVESWEVGTMLAKKLHDECTTDGTKLASRLMEMANKTPAEAALADFGFLITQSGQRARMTSAGNSGSVAEWNLKKTKPDKVTEGTAEILKALPSAESFSEAMFGMDCEVDPVLADSGKELNLTIGYTELRSAGPSREQSVDIPGIGKVALTTEAPVYKMEASTALELKVGEPKLLNILTPNKPNSPEPDPTKKRLVLVKFEVTTKPGGPF